MEEVADREDQQQSGQIELDTGNPMNDPICSTQSWERTGQMEEQARQEKIQNQDQEQEIAHKTNEAMRKGSMS
ncbi:uncharacterized protein BYT42DRAFT_612463 [Radiomyces spectabilis]|uniref:uncharacterized protein n=1 Tax=Radiomyces spectabilis TaxID=64574 RepID=UPI00221E5EA0|nr:uncharacterized protein BYT42DRAFT_612463 [Radiomyces spectabilis]KAI8384790.1 hypothetical protein BYT42DRAFT_612463 [Radiomyces spectabilis]